MVVQVEEATGALGTRLRSETRLQWPAQSLAMTTKALFAALLVAIEEVRLEISLRR